MDDKISLALKVKETGKTRLHRTAQAKEALREAVEGRGVDVRQGGRARRAKTHGVLEPVE
jgi:hypothetical protein